MKLSTILQVYTKVEKQLLKFIDESTVKVEKLAEKESALMSEGQAVRSDMRKAIAALDQIKNITGN